MPSQCGGGHGRQRCAMLACRYAYPNEADEARGSTTVYISKLYARVSSYYQSVTFVTDSADVVIDNSAAALDLQMYCYEESWSKKVVWRADA